jgi:hypothetical protein
MTVGYSLFSSTITAMRPGGFSLGAAGAVRTTDAADRLDVAGTAVGLVLGGASAACPSSVVTAQEADAPTTTPAASATTLHPCVRGTLTIVRD